MDERKISLPKKVIKRDGSVVPFEETKITEAIFAAAKAVGGKDYRLARDLTEQVILFLVNHFTGERVFIEDIQDVVEKVLIESGHARTAKEYILYREKRAEMRHELLVREAGPTSNNSVFVDSRSSERLMPWDKSRISSALIREQQLPSEIACSVASSVESKIFTSGIKKISTGLIRELVDNELFERGMTGVLRDATTIHFPVFNIEQYFKCGIHMDEADPAGFSSIVSRDILRQYALDNVFVSAVSEYHRRSDLHIHYLGDINRIIRKRHCGPVSSSDPEQALSDLACSLGELQSFFVWYPRIDYFNIFFGPLYRYLGEKRLRTALREFIALLMQLSLSSHARGVPEIEIYTFVPSHIGDLSPDQMFTSLDRRDGPDTYRDYYREILGTADIVLEEIGKFEKIRSRIKLNVHVTPFFRGDEKEEELLQRFYVYAKNGGSVEFIFGNNSDNDRRMELLRGGDNEFHKLSINCARLFFDIPVTGYDEVLERCKSLCACALNSGIEKLDFLCSLMRRPDQLLWKLGRKSGGDPVFDVLNSNMVLQMSGIQEGLMFAKEQRMNGEEILAEFIQIARDIIESRGDEYPFGVLLRPGETDSASFRFAEADKEQYPEKRGFFSINRDGRIHYEGVPVLYGDGAVPIPADAAKKTAPIRVFPGSGKLRLVNGYQIDSFRKFAGIAEQIIEKEYFGSLLFEIQQ